MNPTETIYGVRLIQFSVDKLFREFNYTVLLNTEKRITSIIAPNGSGKTVFLRLISALFRRQWSLYKTTEFSQLDFMFSDCRTVSVYKSLTGEAEDTTSIASLGVHFSISKKDSFPALGVMRGWSPKISENYRSKLHSVERYLPIITRISPTKWSNDVTGQQLNFQEILEIYGDQLPVSFLSGIYADEPEDLKDLIDSIDCHLIETQRLLILSGEESSRFRGIDRRPASTLAIAQKAQLLKAIIATSLTEYATLSQSLDRSFPRRVISQTETVLQDTLRQQMRELDEERKQLMDAGLLGTEAGDPVSLPGGNIEGAISRVLRVHPGS